MERGHGRKEEGGNEGILQLQHYAIVMLKYVNDLPTSTAFHKYKII
jgi:hypothetical protein